MIEALDPRRLLSISLSTGTLTVVGSEDPEQIFVSLSRGKYHVSDGAINRAFAHEKIKHIVINGLGGNDTIGLSDSLANSNGLSTFDQGIPDLPVNARVSGGDGNDTILDGGGSDTLLGDDGNDSITPNSGADIVFGGDGHDTCAYTQVAAVDVSLDNIANDGPHAGSTTIDDATKQIVWPFTDNVHSDIETLIGGFGNDTLTGSSADNLIDGAQGASTLDGGAGNDTLVSGSSRDEGELGSSFDGRGPNDIHGGAGIDTVDYTRSNQDLFITLDDVTNDGLRVGENNGLDNVHSDVENVWGSFKNDMIVGGKGNNVFEGGLGNDTLIGGGGNDTLAGGRGNDVLEEGDSPSASGRDLFSGGPGRDTADYSHRRDDLTITLDGVANDGFVLAGDFSLPPPSEGDNVLPDVENIVGGSGNDSLTGNDAGNGLVGNAGHDTLIGLGGDDVLAGGPDSADSQDGVGNVIDGGDGNDTVKSFDSRDRISNVERGIVTGVISRFAPDNFGSGNTGWVLKRDEGFTDIDATGHISLLVFKLGQTVSMQGTIENRNFIERGDTPVLVVDFSQPIKNV